jgi:heavy metal translocating P-type ATPase
MAMLTAAIREYPLPSLALLSLIVGSILHWGLGFVDAANWLWMITLLLAGAPVVYETVKGIRKKQFASDIVATLAILAALLLNDAFPGIIIVLMQTGGKALEDYAYRHASSSIDALISRSPRTAQIRQKGGAMVDVDVIAIQIGDLLVVRPGDIVPVDGSVASASAQMDESSLSGEPLPKSKSRGDKVYSGTVNVGIAFEMKAEAVAGESQYAKIIELVRNAQREKAPIQRLADKYAVWFTPITIAMAAAGWAITRDIQTLLAVLVVATPCSLIFATPVAIISGINKAAKKGIVAKHGAAMELVGKARVVIFDKTGTITYGTPKLERVITLNNITEEELLYKAASLEQYSSHPVAQVLATVGREKFGALAIPQQVKEIAGIGVEGTLDGERISVGSERLIANLQEAALSNNIEKSSKERMVAYVTINGHVSGAIVLSDQIRPGVTSMVSELGKLGITRTVMLTGDISENAKHIAEQAGLTDFQANLLPQDKVTAVRTIKDQYHQIAMVGDGINDAPALASATVGIAMGAKGTAISAEAADIVLLVDDVTKVSETIKISRNTTKVAKQSIFVGLGGSIILMIIASFGFIPPTIGALLQEALDVTVILNALRAR